MNASHETTSSSLLTNSRIKQLHPQTHLNVPTALFYRSIYGRNIHSNTLNFDFSSALSSILYSKHNFGLLSHPILCSTHVGTISSLDIDNDCGQSQYMLSSSLDGTISLFDLQADQQQQDAYLHYGEQESGGTTIRAKPIPPMHKSLKAHARTETTTTTTNSSSSIPQGHSAAITSVQWYTFDTGMFASSSTDGSVLLWDTNTFQTAYIFPLTSVHYHHGIRTTRKQPVTCMSMPRSTISSHSLIATGTSASSCIVLCDVTSGAATHTLQGHGDSVTCLTWSPCNTFELCSGSVDGTIRLWDVRKSGSNACVHILNYKSTARSYDDSRALPSLDCNAVNRKRNIQTMSKKNTLVPVAPNAYAHLQSSHISSHEDVSTAISNIAYTPCGQYLTSVGTDGKLLVWKDAGRCTSHENGNNGIHMYPLPVYFLGEQHMHGPANRRGLTPLLVTSFGTTSSTFIWVGNSQGTILRYNLLQEGGRPDTVLKGHLTSVGSLAVQYQLGMGRIWSGSADGMILGWGYVGADDSRRKKNNRERKSSWWHGVGGSYGRTMAGNGQRNDTNEDQDCWDD